MLGNNMSKRNCLFSVKNLKKFLQLRTEPLNLSLVFNNGGGGSGSRAEGLYKSLRNMEEKNKEREQEENNSSIPSRYGL